MLKSELSILMDYQCEISRMLSRERISKGTVSWQAGALRSMFPSRISTLRFASRETV